MTRFFVITLLTLLPLTTFAQGYVQLVGLPNVPTSGASTETYINALYRLSISIAALLAVGRLILAGAKYVMTDVVTQKGDAKNDIKGALIGLGIVLSAVLILNTINSDLTNFDILRNAATTTVQAPGYEAPPTCSVQRGCENIPECAAGQRQTRHTADNGDITYGCEDTTESLRETNDIPEEALEITIEYICTHPQGESFCTSNSDFHMNKSDAEAKCDRLEGLLVDDPTTTGQGICFYMPPS